MGTGISRRGFLRNSIAVSAGAGIAGASGRAGAAPSDAAEEDLTLTTRVNGTDVRAPIGADTSALSVVRERLGLTGTKEACGHGACGACTVLVDGAPHVSCLLPATALEGREVTTVEGISEPLHPVQRAFLHHDALQCGYCTPGFVVEGAAFCDAWRAERGDVRPTRDEIAAALAGHLCRCGAYVAIYEAVGDACEGKFDGVEVHGPRADGLEKVTGQAKYTVDVKLDGQLEARVLRSEVAHAVLKNLDLSAARALPGVRAVIQLTPVGGKVRFAGQELAAVAADSAHIAEEALLLISPDYKLLPAVIGMDAAREPGAPVLYESKKSDMPSASEGPVTGARLEGNVRGPVSFNLLGRPRRALSRMDEAKSTGMLVVDEKYTTQVQVHSTLEPHACVAHWTSPSTLDVHLSTQNCSGMAEDIAERWALERADVRVLCPYVGGGFGAKATLQMETRIAVDLAREAGAPVRVAYQRDEELGVGGLRPAQELHVALAADAEGNPYSLVATSFSSAGVSVGANSTVLMRLLYPFKEKDVADYDVVSNGPQGRPFRGPGGPPAIFALEQAVDAVAHRRGEDPLALRRRWDPHPGRNRLYDWVETLPAWTGRGPVGRDKGRYRRGVGVACGVWFVLLSPATQIQLDASPEGLVARAGCQDMGNGSRSAVAWAVAEAMGMQPHEIRVRFGDSDEVWAPMSGGSRTTPSVVPTAKDAARQLQEALLDFAELNMGLTGASVGEGGLNHSGGFTPWAEILAVAPPMSFVGRRKKDPGGYFLPFEVAGLRVADVATGSVVLTEVEVDTRLGRVRVVEAWSGISAGRIMVPPLARSQVQGGVIQGISYALYEDRRLCPTSGQLLTAGLEDYRIAGIGDIPPIHVHFDEEGYEGMLERITGIAELATMAPAASVANAVHHATGWRPRSLPLRPDRLIDGGAL